MQFAVSVARWLIAALYALAGFLRGLVERIKYMVT